MPLLYKEKAPTMQKLYFRMKKLDPKQCLEQA